MKKYKTIKVNMSFRTSSNGIKLLTKRMNKKSKEGYRVIGQIFFKGEYSMVLMEKESTILK